MQKQPYRYVNFVSPGYRAVRRFFAQLLYTGTRVACPICERRFRNWLDDPRIGLCPYCRSRARHRFLWLYFAETWKRKHASVELLHFAPEWCLRDRFPDDPRLSRYVTADRGASAIDIRLDITKLPFAEGSFDAIISSHVLEHVVDDRAAMREMFRVLRQKGVAYILVPMSKELPQTDEDPRIVSPRERKRRFGQFDHVRTYGRDFTSRLLEAGFKVSEVRPHDILSSEQIARYGLFDDVIYECARQF